MGTIFKTLCMVMDLPILKLAPLMFSVSRLQTHSDPFTLDRLIEGHTERGKEAVREKERRDRGRQGNREGQEWFEKKVG